MRVHQRAHGLVLAELVVAVEEENPALATLLEEAVDGGEDHAPYRGLPPALIRMGASTERVRCTVVAVSGE